ncbi:unnamed protein product, partial [Cyprideis torosa]
QSLDEVFNFTKLEDPKFPNDPDHLSGFEETVPVQDVTPGSTGSMGNNSQTWDASDQIEDLWKEISKQGGTSLSRKEALGMKSVRLCSVWGAFLTSGSLEEHLKWQIHVFGRGVLETWRVHDLRRDSVVAKLIKMGSMSHEALREAILADVRARLPSLLGVPHAREPSGLAARPLESPICGTDRLVAALPPRLVSGSVALIRASIA